jgi:serine/threonine protein kinase/tetratricopeptide (TPR) repeat protein
MALSPGFRLGPYEILSPLGAGGMGEVYRAKDPRLKREVAIKVLPASFSADADRLRRFEQEAQAAGSLNHPNILTIYDVGTHDGSPYVVSELLEGETLRAQLAGGVFPPRKALGHALQIANGLAAAHDKGIVHRDLKPENVFVTKDGRVKILDFGLAKLTQAESGSSAATDLPTAGTEPGVVLGTIGYMSPEQVRGKLADPRSDIFSFGAILYEMLSGKRAFRGDTTADTMSAILLKEPPDLSTTNRAVSPGLDRVVRHCLEKDPERRFHSAHDLAFGLEALSDVSTPSDQAIKPGLIRRVRPAWFVAGLAAVLVVVAVLTVLRRPRGTTIDSLAVLPFANASADPNSEYLSDGITEGLINSLSQLPRLRVTARTIVSHYKGREAEPQKVGRDLKVSAVLTGKVLQRGDTLVVEADLTDVANGSQLWGDRYSRKMADVLPVEEEIAKEISGKLRLKLTGEEKEKLRKRNTANTEAYQLYLKGRYAWEKRTEEGLGQSIEYFQKAIEKDPGYALAYAGLADSYAVLSSYSIMSPAESFPRARAAARKALEIDEGLAQAHTTLGSVLTDYDLEWSSAESEFRKAIELDPNYATARHWYALLLMALGRFDEALAEMRRAAELDPFSAIIQANTCRLFVYARQYDRAIQEGRKAVEGNPHFGPAHRFLAFAYAAKKMTGEAIAEYEAAATAFGQTPSGLRDLGRAQALAGKRSEALRTIEEMKTMAKRRYVAPSFVAQVFVSLGDKDQALDWWMKACESPEIEVTFLKVDPSNDDLRDAPRFVDLLRKARLAP